MCGWNCEPALRHLWTAHIPFTANRNLLVFCTNTKRTGFARCLFHAPGVLYSHQVHGKLINHAPITHRTRTAQRISGALVYTRKTVHTFVTQSSLFFSHAFQTPALRAWQTTDWWNLKLGWKASGGIYYKCAVSPIRLTKNFSLSRVCIRTYGYTMYFIF